KIDLFGVCIDKRSRLKSRNLALDGAEFKIQSRLQVDPGNYFRLAETLKYSSGTTDIHDINAGVPLSTNTNHVIIVRIIIHIVRRHYTNGGSYGENAFYFSSLLRRFFKQDQIATILESHSV